MTQMVRHSAMEVTGQKISCLPFFLAFIGLHFTFFQILEKVKNQPTLMYSTSTKTAPADHQNIAPYPA